MNKRTEKVTIVEVASEAGVSFGTVSRVINNDVHVKPETRARVLETMRRLNFVANRQARSLAGGKTNTIALLVPDLGTGYIGEIIRGIDSELGEVGFDLMLYTTHRTTAKEAEYVRNIINGMADGLILVLPRNPSDYIGIMTRDKFPFVLIDHQGTGEDCPAIGATNWQGAFNATNYLIQNGHRRIGFITGSLDLGAAVDRFEGYKAALRPNKIHFTQDLVYEGTFAQLDGYTGANRFMNLRKPPTAIFASNDVMAMAAMDAVRERGMHIPEEISIIGFDDIPQSSMIRPSLTTVRQPLEQMGRLATQILFDLINNSNQKHHRIELPSELVIRDSTSKIKQDKGN
jgi:LacI family transcriptional regulator